MVKKIFGREYLSKHGTRVLLSIVETNIYALYLYIFKGVFFFCLQFFRDFQLMLYNRETINIPRDWILFERAALIFLIS